MSYEYCCSQGRISGFEIADLVPFLLGHLPRKLPSFASDPPIGIALQKNDVSMIYTVHVKPMAPALAQLIQLADK